MKKHRYIVAALSAAVPWGFVAYGGRELYEFGLLLPAIVTAITASIVAAWLGYRIGEVISDK